MVEEDGEESHLTTSTDRQVRRMGSALLLQIAMKRFEQRALSRILYKGRELESVTRRGRAGGQTGEDSE